MLYYRKIENPNTKEWVVFLHGLCANSAMWTKQIFSYKQKYNLLLIDLPSHGNSTNAITERNMKDLKDVSDSVMEVLDELNISKAHFAGVSIGTLVVGKIYQLYPQRVQSIVLCGAVASFGKIHEFLIGVLKTTAKFLNPRVMAAIWVDCILDTTERANIRDLFIEQSKHISKADTRSWIEMCVREHNLLYKLDYDNINILFIMGERDKLFLTPIKKLKDKFNNIKLSIIKDSGHIANSHKPEEFNEISLNFLETINN